MKLVVGLGNPGREYEKTRHNIGFMYLDYVTNKEFLINKKFNAMELEMSIDGEKVLFVKPLSFMNNSGEVVIKYVNFYKIGLDEILIIQDDLDMDTSRIKLLYNHGDGGHNGIKNIISNLNSKEFLRLKIGISKANMDTKDYVLGKFSNDEMDKITNSFSKLSNLIFDFVCESRERIINKYNSL